MKRNLTRAMLAACVALLGTAVPAHATSIVLTDTFDPTNQLMQGNGNDCIGTNGVLDTITGQHVNNGCDQITWTFTLTGYSSSTDTVDSATVDVWAYNDAADTIAEGFTITLDGQLFNGNIPDSLVAEGATAAFTYTLSLSPTNPLTDGQLGAVLTVNSTQGSNDFYFGKSTLTANITRDTSSSGLSAVPEPASLFLFGTGAAVLARMKRRSKTTSAK